MRRPDPIFAAIEEHRLAWRECSKVIVATRAARFDSPQEHRRRLALDFYQTQNDRLIATTIESFEGVAAFSAYLAAFDNTARFPALNSWDLAAAMATISAALARLGRGEPGILLAA